MAEFVNSIAYSIIAGLSMMAGMWILLSNKRWASKNSILFIGFAGGVMLTVAFTHILPEAVKLNNTSFIAVLVTLLSFYVLEHLLMIHSCTEGECAVHPMGWISFIGIAVHSLLDGMVITIGFEAAFSIGIIACASVLLHKIPAGMNITAILLHSGYNRKKTILMSLVVAVATPVGAFLSYLAFYDVSSGTLGLLLAISAGSFIYIGAADLLPETHRNSRKSNIILVISGSILVYIGGIVLR